MMQWIYSLTEAERWAYGVAASVITATLLIPYINHRLAMRRTSREAGAIFRATFLSKLAGLYPESANWPADIDHFLRQAFPSLQTAVAQFRPSVPVWRRWAFDRAWFRYRCATGRKIDVQCYHHYIDFDDTDAKGNFRHNVDALLSFAR